jgi:hypothetical protein
LEKQQEEVDDEDLDYRALESGYVSWNMKLFSQLILVIFNYIIFSREVVRNYVQVSLCFVIHVPILPPSHSDELLHVIWRNRLQ